MYTKSCSELISFFQENIADNEDSSYLILMILGDNSCLFEKNNYNCIIMILFAEIVKTTLSCRTRG